ncbi:MAG: Na+/H+ antiporter NhaA [Desulfobacterota bacterium]|nr:Na+/H+ antiporter NhaA [Thermodesulfobacteriota bacterium]
MVTALAALLVANSPWEKFYEKVVQLPITLSLGTWSLEFSLLHWVNEGFMTFFFFIVGMEIKREMLVGELTDIRKAVLPVAAALGGMLVPAMIYSLIVPDEYAHGWGIPMATDIAFCVGVLVMLGRRVPEGALMFLVTLAIADDIGAVIVIALFYTSAIHMGSLAIAAAIMLILIFMNLAGVRIGLLYLLVGGVLWLLVFKSGIHATVAGILVAMCIPARAHYDQALFISRAKRFLMQFESHNQPERSILTNTDQQAILHSMKENISLAESPLQSMLDKMHLPVALLVIPLFAMVNTGIPLGLRDVEESIRNPVTLAVLMGLVAGKTLGISLFSMIALKLRIASLPAGIRFAHVIGVGILGGIGFTMSIFISELSFGADVDAMRMAKTGILFASVLAGIFGYLWMRCVSAYRPRERESA